MLPLRAVLEAQREHTRAVERQTGRIVPWVFHRDGQPIRDFRKSWQTACRRAGVPGRLRHDFRRTAVRNLERSRVPRSAAMAMTGHQTESVYRRYAIVDEAVLREVGERLARLQDCASVAPGADDAASLPPSLPRRAGRQGRRFRNCAIIRKEASRKRLRRRCTPRTSNPVAGSRQVGDGFDSHTLPPRR